MRPGKLIKNQGIIPDVVIERQEYVKKKAADETPEDVFEKVESKEKALKGSSEAEDMKKDNQLEAAVNLMKAIRIYKSAKT